MPPKVNRRITKVNESSHKPTFSLCQEHEKSIKNINLASQSLGSTEVTAKQGKENKTQDSKIARNKEHMARTKSTGMRLTAAMPMV
jgi:hypothetical protein